MIDYEKLIKAHHVCIGTDFYISAEFGHLGGAFIYILNKSQNRRLFETKDTDELITKLNELTKPEPKPLYAVFDVVYHLNDEYQIACMRISEIDLKSDEMYYGVDELNDDGGNWWMEEQLYPTREALIKHQIEYWHGLLFPEDAKSSCCSVHAGTSEECGEFYL